MGCSISMIIISWCDTYTPSWGCCAAASWPVSVGPLDVRALSPISIECLQPFAAACLRCVACLGYIWTPTLGKHEKRPKYWPACWFSSPTATRQQMNRSRVFYPLFNLSCPQILHLYYECGSMPINRSVYGKHCRAFTKDGLRLGLAGIQLF